VRACSLPPNAGSLPGGFEHLTQAASQVGFRSEGWLLVPDGLVNPSGGLEDDLDKGLRATEPALVGLELVEVEHLDDTIRRSCREAALRRPGAVTRRTFGSPIDPSSPPQNGSFLPVSARPCWWLAA
jgi:hypothetical protein